MAATEAKPQGKSVTKREVRADHRHAWSQRQANHHREIATQARNVRPSIPQRSQRKSKVELVTGSSQFGVALDPSIRSLLVALCCRPRGSSFVELARAPLGSRIVCLSQHQFVRSIEIFRCRPFSPRLALGAQPPGP